MVLGGCRRILSDRHDVDDAFQATFLVLVRRLHALKDGDRVGGLEDLVMYVIGSQVYAFTCLASKWDVLELPEGTEPTPFLRGHCVTVGEGHRLHVFSEATGKWSGAEVPAAE